MLRTVIFLPRSSVFPLLGFEILEGLKTSLSASGIDGEVSVVTENIGFGTDEAAVYTVAEKYLLPGETDILVLVAEPPLATLLQPLCQATNTLLLLVNFGAQFPDNWLGMPCCFTHSLNFSFLSYLTGKQAVRVSGKETATAISYYDGGYRMCFSMLEAFQAEGGLTQFHHITKLRTEEFTLGPLKEFLVSRKEIHTLLCLFFGEEALAFYRDIAPVQATQDLALYVSPMMLEPSLLRQPALQENLRQVTGHVPWHPSLTNTANRFFMGQLADKGTVQPGYFSLLGWETGLWIKEINTVKQAGVNAAVKIVPALTERNYDFPSGTIRLDEQTQQAFGAAWLARFDAHGLFCLTETNNVEEAWKGFLESAKIGGERSGWKNTYLCF